MSKIEDYGKLKYEACRSQQWFQLIGARYLGGGGGYGKLVSVEVKATVYHQYRDDATNYHEAPEMMRFALQNVISRRFNELAAEAFADIEADRLKLAGEAQAEHAQLMEAAGLTEASPA